MVRAFISELTRFRGVRLDRAILIGIVPVYKKGEFRSTALE
jgi:hypothetical protein